MADSPESVARRVVDLEMRFMQLEKFVHDLSSVVAAQQRTIDALAADGKRLRERVVDLGIDAGPGEKPPHY